ncbi:MULTISPECIES: lasso peptide biosynthesis B2 protein [unclassified Brevundimonas]|uniref:lasso peptide biosynthesis B2 protein n=1 Tax=unclassified Brevundimonas TaxID=2622653 RepID=UPI0025C14301|nr:MULTISPECIES: lasso peptide biosynthesis B2 protein [unclassified Brevundimonas]
MTLPLWPAPHVHFATIDTDIVLLDVARDRYDCLTDCAPWLTTDEDGRLLAGDTETAEALIDMGFASHAPPPPVRRAPLPQRELTIPVRSPRRALARALVAQATATAIFQKRSLLELIRFNPGRAVDPAFQDRAPVSETRLASLLSAARLARPWIPFEGECLQRAFQLRYYLARFGIATDWVFGVRTWPFSAHCWLQIGDMVVGDRLERVRRYTPIMTA